jgi:hypothetical protein
MPPTDSTVPESFSVEYKGDPIVFFAMREGWRYKCPLRCCNAWHWIETASGEKHRIVSAAKAPVTILASLKCPCYKGCTWHVNIENGIAKDA